MTARAFIYDPPADPYLDVIYQDADILAVNKQSGLLSVPGKPLEHRECVESRAQSLYPSARIVHRLDMGTSGVLLLAMNAEALRNLSAQFEQRKVKKEYVARIWGHPKENTGRVDLPLRCDWPNRPKQMVDHEQGRAAVTDWQVIGRDEISSTVRLFPLTGRSHQLRVHMQMLGHPILGDGFYAHEQAILAADRLQLHAEKLEIEHPSDKRPMTLFAPCPFPVSVA